MLLSPYLFLIQKLPEEEKHDLREIKTKYLHGCLPQNYGKSCPYCHPPCKSMQFANEVFASKWPEVLKTRTTNERGMY